MNHDECRHYIDPVSNRLRKLIEANRLEEISAMSLSRLALGIFQFSRPNQLLPSIFDGLSSREMKFMIKNPRTITVARTTWRETTPWQNTSCALFSYPFPSPS